MGHYKRKATCQKLHPEHMIRAVNDVANRQKSIAKIALKYGID